MRSTFQFILTDEVVLSQGFDKLIINDTNGVEQAHILGNGLILSKLGVDTAQLRLPPGDYSNVIGSHVLRTNTSGVLVWNDGVTERPVLLG